MHNALTTNELLKRSKQKAEETKKLLGYKNPVVVQVAMVVDLDEEGRVRAFAQPDLKFLLDEPLLPFDTGSFVYHRTLDLVGLFVEVDRLDSSSATVNFKDEDGNDDYRRISLSLLTTEIPEEKKVVYVSRNAGFYTKLRIFKEIQDWVNYESEKFKIVPDSERELLYQTIYLYVMPKLDWEAPITRMQEFDEEEIQDLERMFQFSKQLQSGELEATLKLLDNH